MICVRATVFNQIYPFRRTSRSNAIDRIWHTYDSQNQTLVSVFREEELKPLKVFPLRAAVFNSSDPFEQHLSLNRQTYSFAASVSRFLQGLCHSSAEVSCSEACCGPSLGSSILGFEG